MMTHGARSGRSKVDPSVPGCPTGYRHHFRVAGAGLGDAVHGLALRCPDCADRSATEQLTEIVAARRRTLLGLAGLPSRTRADLTQAGTLGEIYRSTVAAVREAVHRCRDQVGIEPPACLRDETAARSGPSSDRARATAVLDAAADWMARLPR